MLAVIYGIIELGYMQTTAANRELASLQTIRGASNAQGTALQDMSVNHRRAEQLLNRSNVVPVFEQVRRKGVAEVWQLARFAIPVRRTAAVTARCTTDSCR